MSAKGKVTKIRVALSRPLTWAEYEHLQEWFWHPTTRVGDSFEKFYVTSTMNSRVLFTEFAEFVQVFVNVFPTAVRTFDEYAGDQEFMPEVVQVKSRDILGELLEMVKSDYPNGIVKNGYHAHFNVNQDINNY